MKRNATYLEAALALLALCLLFSVYLEHHRGHDAGTLATLHTHTVVAETLLVEKKGDAARAVTVYRTLRDTVLLHLTDTLLVKEAIARADTVIAKDSAALQAADRVIAAKDAELHEALKPRYAPRLTATLAALYDPIAGQPLASAGVALRVIGRLALVGRIDQRAAIGERPQLTAGLAFTF